MSNDDASEPNPFAMPKRGGPSPAVNPYAPTSNVSPTMGIETDVEAFRRKYLNHEASIKSIGILYTIPGIFMLLGGVGMSIAVIVSLLTANPQMIPEEELGVFILIAGVYSVVGALQLYAGFGVRKFKPAPRVIITIFSALGLFAVPFGTLISAYILYLLHGEKGKVVFSDAYQEAIRQTPHIKYKTSLIVKILVVLLFAVVLFGVVGLVFAA